MLLLQSKRSKLVIKEFSRNHRNILKIRFFSLNILKAAYNKQLTPNRNKQTSKRKKLSKANLLWWSFRKPQNSHRKFVENQCAVVDILQLLQLTRDTVREKDFFFLLHGMVSVLFLSTQFHVM